MPGTADSGKSTYLLLAIDPLTGRKSKRRKHTVNIRHPRIVEWWIDLHHPPPVMKDGDQELVGATNERRMREYREAKRPYRQAYTELGMGLAVLGLLIWAISWNFAS